MQAKTSERSAFIKRTSHEQRLAGWRRYVLYGDDSAPRCAADDPAELYDAADRIGLSVPQREAWLGLSGTDWFELVLFERGVCKRREHTQDLKYAGLMIEAWHGPLTDRHARYSVRGGR